MLAVHDMVHSDRRGETEGERENDRETKKEDIRTKCVSLSRTPTCSKLECYPLLYTVHTDALTLFKAFRICSYGFTSLLTWLRMSQPRSDLYVGYVEQLHTMCLCVVYNFKQ